MRNALGVEGCKVLMVMYGMDVAVTLAWALNSVPEVTCTNESYLIAILWLARWLRQWPKHDPDARGGAPQTHQHACEGHRHFAKALRPEGP